VLKHQGLNFCQIYGIIGWSLCVCKNYIENQRNIVKTTGIQKNQNYFREQKCLFVMRLPIQFNRFLFGLSTSGGPLRRIRIRWRGRISFHDPRTSTDSTMIHRWTIRLRSDGYQFLRKNEFLLQLSRRQYKPLAKIVITFFNKCMDS